MRGATVVMHWLGAWSMFLLLQIVKIQNRISVTLFFSFLQCFAAFCVLNEYSWEKGYLRKSWHFVLLLWPTRWVASNTLNIYEKLWKNTTRECLKWNWLKQKIFFSPQRSLQDSSRVDTMCSVIQPFIMLFLGACATSSSCNVMFRKCHHRQISGLPIKWQDYEIPRGLAQCLNLRLNIDSH